MLLLQVHVDSCTQLFAAASEHCNIPLTTCHFAALVSPQNCNVGELQQHLIVAHGIQLQYNVMLAQRLSAQIGVLAACSSN